MKVRGMTLKISGFTLIELLITVAIVALLASIALPVAEVGVQRGREQDLRRGLRDIREALDSYRRAAVAGEIDGAAPSGYPPSLAVLAEGAPDKKTPGAKVYFLRRVPADPVSKQPWGLRSYESSAAEPKAGADVYDVYSVSPDRGLNGIAYRDW